MDVSNCSQEEAVQVFLSAEEPITVEVKRRTSSTSSTISSSASSSCSQTSSTNGVKEEGTSPKRTPVLVENKSETTTAEIGVQTDDLEQLLGVDEEELELEDENESSPVSEQIVNIFDECLVPDVDFEVS